MPIIDLSRAAFAPEKRYASVGFQMGRVASDDDLNEAERIESEDERQERLDVIGPAGSPDDGFRVGNGRLGPGGQLDFDIAAGTFYLGGLRLWNPALTAYAAQPDWLQQPPSARAAPVNGRVDLAFLESWQQPVTAIEDAELFEAALAGPDTSTRLRTMWRVRLASGVDGSDCPGAFAKLAADWAAAHLGTLNAEHERVTNARLTVTFPDATTPDDLCSPEVAGGYLGAENQAIRVEIVDARTQTFTWGFDNASPLYRARIGADRRTITLLTEPKDHAHWPLAGQNVELLPWGAVLSNGEKTAEVSGHLAKVSGSYDPDAHTIVLGVPFAVPAGFGEGWTTRPDQAALAAPGHLPPGSIPADDPGPYVFLRVWNRGDDTSSAPAIAMNVGNPVPLGGTGLEVTFTGTDFVKADHWIIAARPETPDTVVPWDFSAGRPVNGLRRFFAPLALIRWTVDGAGARFDVLHDCRPFFPSLTRLPNCCTYTVGDGVHSHGRFTSVQAAVNALPAEGGKICVLAGRYAENVVIAGRHDVVIEGCGPRTRLVGGQRPAPAVLRIWGSARVTVRDLAVEANDRIAILIDDVFGPSPVSARNEVAPHVFALAAASPRDVVFDDARARVGVAAAVDDRVTVPRTRVTVVRLEKLTLDVHGLPALATSGGTDIVLRDSQITCAPLDEPLGQGDPGRWPAVYLLSDDVLIERNRITARAPRTLPTAIEGIRDSMLSSEGLSLEGGIAPGAITALGSAAAAAAALASTRRAMGGIQVGGGCERVEIRRNLIDGGNGHGVILGSVAWVPRRDLEALLVDWIKLITIWRLEPSGFFFIIGDDGCIQIVVDPVPPRDGDEPPPVPISMGALIDIAVRDNTIIGMGGCGVGVARWFDPGVSDDVITVDRLTIERNLIRGNLQVAIPELPERLVDRAAFGGIALADGETIVVRDNVIEANGLRHVDPVCGVFALSASDIGVERNRIVDNAPAVRATDPVRPGFRGGVVLPSVTPMTVTPSRPDDGRLILFLPRPSGPAARVRDNVIVVPEGRALLIGGPGPIAITDNQLVSRGASRSSMGGLSSFISATATLDVGISIANKLGTLGATIDRLGGGLALVFNTGRSPLVGSFQPIKYAAFTHLEVGANPAITEVAVGDQPGAIAEPQPELRIGVTGVMFHDNQGLLDLAGAADLSVLTSVLIYSLGDATAQGNQLEVRQGRNLVFIDLAAFAVSVRAAGNLFVEATVGTILSAYTHGVLNTTVDNHATHCILALGALTVFEDNLVVQQGGNPRICGGTIGLGDRLVDRYIGRPIERVV